MPLVRKKKNGVIVSPFWYYDFRIAGKRYRESTNTTSKAKATLIEAEARLRAEGGAAPPMRGQRAPLLRDFLSRFTAAFEANQLIAANTKRYYSNGVRLLKATPLMDVRLDHITPTVVAGVEFPGSGSNANNAIRTLSVALSYALELGLLRSRPELHLYEEREREETFSPEQEQSFLRHADQDTADAYILLVDSGMRPEECVRSEVTWIRWDLNLIRVINGKSKGYSRDIPMTARTKAMLSERLNRLAGSRFANHRGGRWILPSKKRGKHISVATLRAGFNRAKKAANLPPGLVLYCTRHTYGTDLAELGNPKLTMKVMGHSELKTSARYQHPETAKVSDFLDRRNAKRKSVTTPAKDFGHTFGHTTQMIQ